jgi:CPA2 family monovalent cation:H+ antiporter-2
MLHQTPLIATIAAGLVLAFALGLLAHRLRIQPLVGYLLAGILVGPFTPGFVADQSLATELAEIGVILLMFGVGLHFSLKDLLSVGRIAVPGAIGQIAAATAMGAALATWLGWSLQSGLVFGLALSVASTVVLVRALQDRRLLETERGRIAVGWLVVEDLVMVLALVMLPAIALASTTGGSWVDIAGSLVLTLAKVGAFAAVMFIGGRRFIPWLMEYTAQTGSRELFRLAVYAIALGVAYGAYKLFGASFALGAFFAGMVLGESPLSQRATEEAIPLRDAFAVLFFVSVGMLLNPAVIIEQPLAVLLTVLIIVVGKSVAAYLIVRAFGYSNTTALTISASLAQIGEFSFILAGLGIALGMLDGPARDLILAGAIFSIVLNPVVFTVVQKYAASPAADAIPRDREHPGEDGAMDGDVYRAPPAPAHPGHEVLVGYGRVGSYVGRRLLEAGSDLLVVEDRLEALEAARRDGAKVIVGNAADPEILELADLASAARLYITIPEAFEAGQIVKQARTLRPDLEILARAHSKECVEHLDRLGATVTILGEVEVARRMLAERLGTGMSSRHLRPASAQRRAPHAP